MTTFNGFEPANTTPVPDTLFDVLLSKLSGAELKVMLYIIRRTLGFKKTDDTISLTQFEKGIVTTEGKVLDKGCGLNRETICKALQSLETMGCIKSNKRYTSHKDKDTTLYSIRFSGDEEVVGKSDHVGSRKNGLPVVGKTDYGSRIIPEEVVGKSDLQETVLQDTVKQETVLQERDVANATARSQPSSQKENGDGHTHQHSVVDRDLPANSHQPKPSQPVFRQDTNKVTHPPAPRKPPSNKTIPEPELTPDEQAVFDAWCSLFKVAVPLIPANARACKQLAKPLQVWTGILDKSTAEVLKLIMNWAYKNDKNGYYKRGFKLYDAAREFEGWQSAQERPQGDKDESNEHRVSSFGTPGFNFADEFYPSEAEKKAYYAAHPIEGVKV